MTDERIDVLDSGFVQYVSHMGSDLTVVNAARVSFHKISEAFTDKDAKLIQYLAKHNHWTPFAHPQVTIRIKTPIFIRAQLGKHQVGLVMNEVSRRYVSDPPTVYVPSWRGKPTGGAKQGSDGFMELPHESNALYVDTMNACLYAYEKLLEEGVAPEQARSILPQGTYTEWWWTGSLAAFARIYTQRIDPHAQWECQKYAEAIGNLISPLFPHSWAALTNK